MAKPLFRGLGGKKCGSRDKTDPFDTNWQKKLWSIHFTTATSGSYYNVSSDLDKSGLPAEKIETAIDPSNGKYMYHHHNNPIPDFRKALH